MDGWDAGADGGPASRLRFKPISNLNRRSLRLVIGKPCDSRSIRIMESVAFLFTKRSMIAVLRSLR